jgi:hypothetical protein
MAALILNPLADPAARLDPCRVSGGKQRSDKFGGPNPLPPLARWLTTRGMAQRELLSFSQDDRCDGSAWLAQEAEGTSGRLVT